MLKKYAVLCLILALSAVLIVGCGRRKRKGGGEEEKSDAPAKAAYASKGDEGSVTGRVMFDGQPPAPDTIDMSQDPNCASAGGSKVTEAYVVKDGKLANVFVYLKGGPADSFKYPIPSEAVVLDQKGCRYHPHVLGLMAGQTLTITNSDPAAHNVHPSPKYNEDFNKSQPPGAPPIEHKFARPETLIPVKCNQHPWMKANIGVLAHPFYAVSGEDGAFSIKGVPPGSYTLVFYHEALGEQSQKVTVAANGTVTQDVTYKAGGAAKPATFLQIEPELILP
jgi:plastocyanin